MALIKPNKTSAVSNYWIHYNKEDVHNFISGLNYISTPLNKTETLYIEEKGISQDKLRTAGFKITRIKANADLVVIGDTFNLRRNDGTCYYFSPQDDDVFQATLDFYIAEEPLKYTYINKKDIYPYLYKYMGDKAMFESISELLVSCNKDNAKIAMEYMSNANWEENEIYLQEIFSLYYIGEIHDHPYKTSISFRGFLDTLTFNYKFPRLHCSKDYRNLCITEEHHEWVHGKYDSVFKVALKELLTKYKLKLNALDVSIDYEKVKEEDDE